MTKFKPGDRVRFVDKNYVNERFKMGEILTVERVSGKYLYFKGKGNVCLVSPRVELVKNETPKVGDEVEIIVKGRVSGITDVYIYLEDNVIGVNRKYEVRVTKPAPVFPEEPGTIIRSKNGVFEYVRIADKWVEVGSGEPLVITPTFKHFEVLFPKENEND